MLSDEDLARARKVARLRAKDLSRNHHDREDIEQEAVLAALQKPEFSNKAARWGAANEKARQMHRDQVRDRSNSGRFKPKPLNLDVEALQALPTVRQAIDDLIRRALSACEGRTALAAAAIGMGHSTLKRRLRAWRGLGCDAHGSRRTKPPQPAEASRTAE